MKIERGSKIEIRINLQQFFTNKRTMSLATATTDIFNLFLAQQISEDFKLDSKDVSKAIKKFYDNLDIHAVFKEVLANQKAAPAKDAKDGGKPASEKSLSKADLVKRMTAILSSEHPDRVYSVTSGPSGRPIQDSAANRKNHKIVIIEEQGIRLAGKIGDPNYWKFDAALELFGIDLEEYEAELEEKRQAAKAKAIANVKKNVPAKNTSSKKPDLKNIAKESLSDLESGDEEEKPKKQPTKGGKKPAAIIENDDEEFLEE